MNPETARPEAANLTGGGIVADIEVILTTDGVVEMANDLLARPFPNGTHYRADWLDGSQLSCASAHFAPVARSESLYETPADVDGSIGELYDQVYDDFERRRHLATEALSTRWGPARNFSFAAVLRRMWGEDDIEDGSADDAVKDVAGAWEGGLSSCENDLALFAGVDPSPAWVHGDRLVTIFMGHMDKEFPLVLTLVVIAREAAAAGVLDS